ncbi:MAG: ABC transporter permease [Puia sp.]|nr:ABC transporter permease [Puia sp.]
MLKSYFRIAWRSLLKNRGYSSINIAGLATGMAIAGLIGLWIADEISFDSYFSNHPRLARVMINQATPNDNYTGEVIAVPLGNALKTQYAGELKRVSQVSFPENDIFAVGDKKIAGSGCWVQQDFPVMFSLHMASGDPDALKDPSTVLLSRSLAIALFGNTDIVGKTVRWNNKLELKLGGVYEDLPRNTSFYDTKALLPWGNPENAYLNKNTNWDDHNSMCYAELAGNKTAQQVTAKVKTLPTSHVTETHEETLIYPLDRAHLYSEFVKGKPSGGRIRFVRLFGIIGFFVLLLACINFMNLSTARSEKRAKEVGIRKTIGSLRKQLVAQFLSESILVAFLAFLVAIALMVAFLPLFNSLAGKQMVFPLTSPLFWSLALCFTLFTGVVSGSYPAFYLSGFQPIKVLKGAFRAGRYASLPRQVLVIVQFSVSLILIIGTIVVYRQIQYAKDRPVGYTRAGLINIEINTPDLDGRYDLLRNDLLQTGVVDNMAESSQPMSNFGSNNAFEWRGKRPDQKAVFFYNVNVTPDFGKTVGWTITDGRDFSREHPSDSSALILSEAAAKIIGIPHPVGEIMTFFGRRYTVIGVAKDMITNSPYRPVDAAVFLGNGYFSQITVRLKRSLPMHKALAAIEPVFRRYNPGSPFLYKFIDEEYARKFSDEERVGDLSTVFASFAIFISCLGLFGLAAFVAEQRTKEIGVRKVLGANLFNLWGLLSKDFLKLVFLSLFLSIPIAYYVMYQWLQNYSYRTDIPLWVFGLSAVGILLITLLTVSFQSIRAALMNPVKSLRSE